jgi:soluble lytic murein transglycosylase-like protein
MSTQAVGGAVTGMPAGELAIVQRVQQLQEMIEAARQGTVSTLASSPATGSSAVTGSSATGSSYAPSSTSDFAAALQAATTADAAGVADPATLADGSSLADGASLADGTSLARASGVTYDAALQGSSGGGEGGEYEGLIEQAAARNGLDPAVLHGLIEQESGFDPTATSSAGASGLTQLMPGTASSLGVANPLDPAESIEGGARYLGQLMGEFGGNTEDALAAYNAGPGAVEQYGGVPPYAETQSYVTKVLGNAEAYRQTHPSTALSGSLT